MGRCGYAPAGQASSRIQAAKARMPNRSRSGSVRAAAEPHPWTDLRTVETGALATRGALRSGS